MVSLFNSATAFSEVDVEYDRDVRSILSDKCFECHGPDTINRKADLRLDTADFISEIVAPGQPDLSDLFLRITNSDASERMPPLDSGRALSSAEVATLKRWIEQGAQWKEHWSFSPAKRPKLPVLKDSLWSRGAIDEFVSAKLRSAGLQPSHQADKETLLRRVSFDLTGLSPSLMEIDAFISDSSPRAFEKVVDRLLASPRYGERMALNWLDAARYADSHGYSLDRRRVMWPWRDWVIEAFNKNLSYDQFIIEQLAGDLLPEPTLAQKVATGFNRNHSIQSEGGVIDEEYRVETVVDRVETTSAVFLGLTFGCARCHDHKYDPISQEEFYAFYALFNNVPEQAHVGNSDKQADQPFLKAPSVFQHEQLAKLRMNEKQLITEVGTALLSHKMTEKVWIDDNLPEGVDALGNGGGGEFFEFVNKPDHPVYSGNRSHRRSSKGRGQHLVQNAKDGLNIDENTKLFSYVYLDPDNPPKQIMLQWNDSKSWEHRAYWGEGKIEWGQENTSSRRKIGPLPKSGEWVRLEIEANKVGLDAGTKITGWAFTQFDGTVYWDKSGLISRKKSNKEIQLDVIRDKLNKLEEQVPTTMVMGEKTPPRKTFVLNRGQYDQPGEVEVNVGLPSALGRWPINAPRNRLGFAKWLVSRENPLTARVTVNRLWQMHFGVGIVGSSEDFGAQGEWPTHPDLLDWLAEEFMVTGWNLKAMHKQIVMSATYQQTSRVTPRLLEVDPMNRLLARGPRFRLSAEMIRDHALSASGLMVAHIGGESVKPYQPPGLWGEVVFTNVPRFQQDHGEKLYRRSMYTYWKRSVPPPNMQVFDAPSREVCVLKRPSTNTPLAALVLMNDPTFVEASRKLAERVLLESETNSIRVDSLYRLICGRKPKPMEHRLLLGALNDMLIDFRADRDSAADLMTVGESDYDRSFDLADLAAFTSLANAVFCTDEAITRN
ncbi:MAG: PSD1 and planctomycete cytochrome C domain-containing protein [Verrucomicrobiota bacterium]|nr:PSD1 and planctomycete cytochrome C domain-containing protein [Verrucomicrobiota bacterium]